jgi:hypothetical protein
MMTLLSEVVVLSLRLGLRSMKLSMLVRVLKIDCKGCDYDVIGEDDILKLLDIVEIKYNGCYRDKAYRELKSALKTLGFTCRVWARNDGVLRVGLDRHGMITCAKNPYATETGYSHLKPPRANTHSHRESRERLRACIPSSQVLMVLVRLLLSGF